MFEKLNGQEETEALDNLKLAGEVAFEGYKSGLICQRASCGTVIVKDGKVIGEGFNAPPNSLESQRRCHRKHELKEGFVSDRTCCIHAEHRAIQAALMSTGQKLNGSTLYFTRVDEKGKLLHSGQPYCTMCSKMALEAGVKYWVLWHKDGVVRYRSDDYNDISFASEGKG